MIKKIKNIYHKTLDSDYYYEGDIENINFYNFFMKSGIENFLFNLSEEITVCSCKYKNENKDSILFVFSFPINDERNYRSKFLSEKVINIIDELEKMFVVLDIVKCDEIKKDKFIYLTIVINEDENNEK